MEYIIANPTGNITALVTDEVAQSARLSVVREIFETEPSCEQVGFVNVTGERRVTLEMMGGEFCGNATLSAAAYCATANNLFEKSCCDNIDHVENNIGKLGNPNRAETVIVDSSGADEPVSVELRCLDAEAGEYEGTLEMPMPRLDGTVVHLDGISHMIVPSDTMSHEEAEAAIKGYADQFDALAFGMLLYTEDGDAVSIEPLVYVKGSETLVWEHGCASGSIAAAYYKYSEGNKSINPDTTDKKAAFTVAVHQPGGIITIDIEDDKLFLTGKIQL